MTRCYQVLCPTAGPKKKKKKRKKRGNKNDKATKAADASATEEPNSEVDMSAWDGLFVPEPVQRALRRQGFSQPTDVQGCTKRIVVGFENWPK